MKSVVLRRPLLSSTVPFLVYPTKMIFTFPFVFHTLGGFRHIYWWGCTSCKCSRTQSVKAPGLQPSNLKWDILVSWFLQQNLLSQVASLYRYILGQNHEGHRQREREDVQHRAVRRVGCRDRHARLLHLLKKRKNTYRVSGFLRVGKE
jgi:hypothetical protein